ncbi:MAG: hypothetical protein KDA93_12475 [Planctomycetaceae bacterium]|nr:hypothetical protein [Planctomycetaceae bacterium]
MSQLSQRNGHRLPNGSSESSNLPAVTSSQKQQLLAQATGNDSLQSLLATVSSSPSELMGVLTKALGPAEAEIQFREKITVRED